MCYKTVYRAAYSDITIDSQKIDDDYMRLKQMESTLAEAKVAQEIAKNANGEIIDVVGVAVEDEPEPEQEQPSVQEPPRWQPTDPDTLFPPTGTDGPGPGF